MQKQKRFCWISTLLFLLSWPFAFAQQKQGAIWRMGNWEINFNQSPRALYQRPGISPLATAEMVYCDAQGRVLATTNRFDSLKNRFGGLMPGARPDLSTVEDTVNSNRVFVPDPANPKRFYIFQNGRGQSASFADSTYIKYYHADLDLDSGRGDLLFSGFKKFLSGTKNNTWVNAFDIIKHPNNRDYVIGYYSSISKCLAVRLLTDSGVGNEICISDTFSFERFEMTGVNYIGRPVKFSPDGKLLFVNTSDLGFSKYFGFLYKLNLNTLRATRICTLIVKTFNWPNNYSHGGPVAFSPNSKVLYCLEKGGVSYLIGPRYKFNQFNLESGDSTTIVNSMTSFPITPEENELILFMQLGMDGKLYYLTKVKDNPFDLISMSNTYLNQVNCPNVMGPGCGVQQRVQRLYRGLIKSFDYYDFQSFSIQNTAFYVNANVFQAQAAKDTICQGDSVWLSAYGASTEQFEWREGNSSNILASTSNIKISPAQTTTYKVRGLGSCGQKDTSITIYVVPRPISPFKGDTSLCGNQKIRFTGRAFPSGFFTWKSDLDTTINAKDSASVLFQVPKVPIPTNGFAFVRITNPGCTVSDSIKIRVWPTTLLKPGLSVSGDTSICQKDTLKVLATSPLSYGLVWNTGDTTKQVSLFQAGIYSVKIKNEFGCAGDSARSFTLGINPLPITQTLSNNKKDSTLCFPAQIQLGINPEPNISYTWQGDSLGNNLISNPIFQFANLDTIVLTRNLKLETRNQITGCSNLDSLTITLVPNLRPFAGPDKSFCAENQAIIGQKGFAGFVYQWSPATGLQNPQSAQTRTNFENPSYENELKQTFIRSVSLLGCQAKDTVEVRVFPKVPKPQLAGPQFVCPGVRNVPYQFSTIPAISGFQVSSFRFQISGGDSVGKWFVNWNEENENGGIKMKLGNIYGCQTDSVFLPVSITRNLRPQTQIWAGINDSICLAAAQNIKYEIQNFNPQSRYNWSYSPNSVSSNPTLNFELSTFNAPGIYTLTLSESDTTPIARCFGKTDYQIRIWPQPEPSLILGRDSVCEGLSSKFKVESSKLGSRYDWKATKGMVENVVSNGAEVDYSADFKPNGDFETIEISNTETSEKGCIGPENKKTITVESLPNPKIEALDGPIKWDALLQNFRAIGRSQSQFYWTAENGELQSAQGLQNALVAWLPNQTFYSLQVKESTALGCEGESEKLLPEINKTLFFPNLITANGDEKNDQFRIENLHFYPENELEIYNRWGKKVFSASPYLNNWPREKQISGIYFFLFKSTNGQHQAGQILILH